MPGVSCKYLSHAKLAVITTNNNLLDDNSVVYLGSHNLSEAAWGLLTPDGMHLNIANYEVGVIFPPENNSTEMKNSIVGSLINFPPHTYTATDEPFMFTFT